MQTPACPYLSPIEALEETVGLVKIGLRRHLLLYAHRFNKPADGYEDLYVGRAEVETFLSGTADAALAQRLAELDAEDAALRAHLAARTETSVAEGTTLPLEEFRAAFGITEDTIFDCVILLLAAELFPQFVRAFAFAWADFTRRHVDVGFLLECCAKTAEEREQLLLFFLRRSHPLFLFGCIELFDPPGTGARPFVQTGVRLTPRIVQFLGGEVQPPIGVIGLRGRLWEGERTADSVLVGDSTRDRFLGALRDAVGGVGPQRIFLVGPDGVGRRSLAHVGASHLGRPLLSVDLDEWMDDPKRLYSRLAAVVREAALHNAIPMFCGADGLDLEVGGAVETRAEAVAAIENIAAITPGAVLFGTRRPIRSLMDRLTHCTVVVIPPPDAETQTALWRRFLPPETRFAPGFGIGDIVARYSLTGGTIKRVAARCAAIRGTGEVVEPSRMTEWIRDELSQRLGSLATTVTTGHTWDDLIVPQTTRDALDELTSFVRHRRRIVAEWGIGAKTERGRGIAALFFGPPGTGKTMAASLVGAALGMEVFQIDLSQVVDKYIGETEKNLGRMFDEGARAQAVLLFDEADSLFGKRTGVSSATDRYSNLEINFLLQRLERYEGISILTSNFPELIDDAFKRRIRFKVEFPFPTPEERRRLWETMIPSSAPLDGGVSLEHLARSYELTGAHIQNVILRAAAMAANEGTGLTMAMMTRAANREYAELGNIVRE